MKLDFQYAAAAFNQLKPEARCDRDVVNWLQQHPEVFRDAADCAYASLRIVDSCSQTRPDYSTGGIRHDIQLCIVFTHDPASTLLPENAAALVLRCWHVLTLPAGEWPYVAASFAPYVLFGEFTGFSQQALLGLWDELFPMLPWQRVLDIHAAGLLSSVHGDVMHWLLDAYAMKVTPALGLPDSLVD